VPQELVALVFATQEELSELRAAGNSGAEENASVKKRRDEVGALLERLGQELNENFATFDRADEDGSEKTFEELKRILSAVAYLKTLMRDVDKALDIKAAA
jgi:hypothetical protein